MQTCKLWVEPNFLFQLCPSFSFMMVWYTCQKTVTAATNTNQREMNERRTGSTDFKLFKFRQEWNVSLIFTFVTTWCEAKGWGVFPSRMWCMWRADMWGSQPSQPSWTPAELLGTCFLQRQVSLFTAQQSPFLASPRLVMEGFILPITIPVSWIIPVLRSVRWVPAGHDCRHRWVSRPVMASICHCALASVWFLYCFSFCLSSFSLLFFVFLLKMPHWDWEAVV